MPRRNYASNEYRYGWNKGSEKDDEITGVTGSHITTFFREYDTRLGRTWSLDPVFQPWQSSYSSMDNNPIWFNDPRGDKVKYGRDGATGKERREVRRDIKSNKKFDSEFADNFKSEKSDKTKIFRYIRNAEKSEAAILPSEASSREWAPSIGDALPVETKTYNPTGNNIPRLDASFEPNTNILTDYGNADVIANKLNKLFAINNNVEIHLKGSTSSGLVAWINF